MSTNLSNITYLEITNATYTLTATSNTVSNPSSGFVFYVGANTTTSTLTFDLTGIIFEVPVIFTTKPYNGSGLGDGKNITILGNVIFNKGVVFETNGRYNTAQNDLSIFNLGDGTNNLQMSCKYTLATLSTNLVPLNINGYGIVNFNANTTINTYMHQYAVACIDQSSNIANITQDAGNILNVYMDSQMLNTNVVDMRQYIVYPDASPLVYNLYITDDVDIQLVRFPQSYQIYVTAENATLTDIDFTDNVSANINIANGATLTFEDSSFAGASPLISLTGSGTLTFSDSGINNLTPNNSGVLFTNADGATINTSSFSKVNLPTTYTFNEPVDHYEGFNFIIDSNSTYSFGTFNNKTLYVTGKSNSTSTISITAHKGLYLTVDTGSKVNINNSSIYSSFGNNGNFAVRKQNSGSYEFTGANNLFIYDSTYFIEDTSLDNSTTYTDVGEDTVKFYLLDDVTEGTASFFFSSSELNLNTLYYISTQGVYLGTNNGDYNLHCNFLIKNTTGTLSLGTSGGTGLVLKNDTSGDYAITAVEISGGVGDSVPDESSIAGRLVIDTSNTCEVSLYACGFYDSDYVPSPLIIGDNASGHVTCDTAVNFYMNSTQLTYPYNYKTLNTPGNAFITIGAIRGDKTYDLDININDTTSDAYTYKTDPYYIIPIKFAADNIYTLENINFNGVILYDTNSPTLELYTFNSITVYHVENEQISLYNDSELSNENSSTTAVLLLQPNDLTMPFDVNNCRINVYGFGSVNKVGAGTLSLVSETVGVSSNDNTTAGGLTIGNSATKDMETHSYQGPYNPAAFQSQFFPGMANFVDGNIVQGDKTVNDKNTASYWRNLTFELFRNMFTQWGNFYIYDVATGKYYFPILNPVNQADGSLTTQTFNVFGRTYTIRHGWAVQGIFKFDITSSDSSLFRFGAYGTYATIQYTASQNLTYNIGGTGNTLYYHRSYSSNVVLPNQFFSYFIPKNLSENNSQPYNVYYVDNNKSNTVSTPISSGLLVYFSVINDVKEWVVNDLNISINYPEIHYYTNDYDFNVNNVDATLEYDNTIFIHNGNYSFVNAANRLSFNTVTDGENPTFTNSTIITKGITINHNKSGTITFSGIDYTMLDNDGEFIINGTGTIVCNNNCSFVSNVGVTYNLIGLAGSNNFTIDVSTATNNGTGALINVGNNAILTIMDSTINNNNGQFIYSTSGAATDILFDTVIFNNNADSAIITHLNNNNIVLDNCTINQETVRNNNMMIEFGDIDSIISGNLTLNACTFGTTETYNFAIKAYTTGIINTGSTTMDATHTNIYWPNLGDLYDGTSKVPYVCADGKGYVAYSYDPTIPPIFTHDITGLKLDDNIVSNYYLYAAVGDNNNDALTSITATLSCTEFNDLNYQPITTNLNNIFTSSVFATGYVGSINSTNTQTLAISDTDRLKRILFAFTDSSNVYLGYASLKIDFNTTIVDYNYSIVETIETPPAFSLNASTLSVVDTINNSQYLTVDLTIGYLLPIYIVPVNNNIIDFFTFRNNAVPQVYVDNATYSGYVNTSNKNLLQYIPTGNTSYNFYIKYVGTGIYYQPADLTGLASLILNLYSDNIDESSSIGNLSVNVDNGTDNYKFPLSYVDTLTTYSSTTILYDTDENSNSGQLATLYRPSGNYADFKIRYTFTLKFLMPLVTFDGSNHNILISGVDYYETGYISYIFSNLTDSNGNAVAGGTLTDNNNNTCNISYDGNDLTEKRITVQVDISNIGSTQNGIIYYKKKNHEIQFTLTDTVDLKGFDNNNNIIEIVSGTQTASSYYEFPGTLLTQAVTNGTTYSADNNTTSPPTFPQIDVNKGDTVRLSLLIGGQITSNTPGVDENGLNIPIYLATSKDLTTDIMAASISDTDSIIIAQNSYQGYKDITFTQDNKISGSGSTYTITFDQTNYPTVDKVEYVDLSRPHTITHNFAIQPNTRVLENTVYESDNNNQAPSSFSADSDVVAHTPSIAPSTYYVSFPMSVRTDFIPYNTTTGASSSFRVQYVLVGTKPDTTVATLTKSTHYQTYTINLSNVTNDYINISGGNYDEDNYIYFTLLTQEYQYIDIYAYYTNASGTDMANVPANNGTGNKQFLARYDFSNASATATDTLQLNLGAWTIKPNSNGDLVFVYNGTIDGQNNNGAGSTFTIPAPTTVVNKTFDLSNA